MSHTAATLFADMLSLLNRMEFAGSTGDGLEAEFNCCPICLWNEEHSPGCHLQATIALAEAQLRIVGE